MAEFCSSVGAQNIIRTLCDICEQDVDARWFCVDCEETLCDGCKRVHLKSKKTKNDNVVTLKEARDDGVRKPANVTCDEHTNLTRDIYCCTCESVICLKCLDRKHKSHEWKMISDAMSVMTKELEEFKSNLSEKLEGYAKCSTIQGQIHSELVSEIGLVKEQIIGNSSKILQVIANNREKLLSQLLHYESTENKRYTEFSSDYEQKRASVTDLITGIEAELLQQRPHTTANMVKKLKNTKVDVMVVSNEKDFKIPVFVPGELDSRLADKILGFLDQAPMVSKSKECSKTSLTGATKKGKDYRTTSKSKDIPKCPPQKGFSLKMSLRKSIKVVDFSKPVCAICPDNEGGAWIAIKDKTYLHHIDKDGKITGYSSDVGFEVQAAAMDNKGALFVIAYQKDTIKKLSNDGKTVSTFANIGTVIYDFCTTPNGSLAIGRHNCCQICLLDSKGDIEQKVKASLGSFILKLTCSTLSTILGIFKTKNDDRCVKIYSSKLALLVHLDMNTWDESSFKPLLPTAIHSYFYICAEDGLTFYVIKEDGSNPKCLKHTHGTPFSIATDTNGRIWYGSDKGKIKLLE